jgi:hypothetical protein
MTVGEADKNEVVGSAAWQIMRSRFDFATFDVQEAPVQRAARQAYRFGPDGPRFDRRRFAA